MDPQHGQGLTFSEALEQLKDGRKVTRARWTDAEGRDQWIVRQDGYPQGIPLNANTARATGLPEGSEQKFAPYYMLYTIYSTFVPWTPGHGDLNADDWAIYYMPGEYERLCQEETDAILADPEARADLEADGDDARTFSHDEVKMAVALRALERDDFPDRENVRFRLLRQLMRPVTSKSFGDEDLTTAGIVATFVDILTGLNRELTQTRQVLDDTKAKIDSMEEFDRAWRNRYPVPEGLNSNDAILAYARIRCYQDGWKDTPGFTQTTWRLITTLLGPMLEEWRRDLGPELGEGADGWKAIFGGLRVDGVDTIGSMTIELVPTPTAQEMQAFAEELGRRLDPEATQQLIRPGDPGYPERPQRLTDAYRLRQTFDGETPAEGPRTIRRAAPDAEPTQVVKYFVTDEGGFEREVPEGEYLRVAGITDSSAALPDSFNNGFNKGRMERTPQ